MIKISKDNSKINAVLISELQINRVNYSGDRVIIKYALLNAQQKQIYGSATLENIKDAISATSKKLMSTLMKSLEADVAKLFSNESTEEDVYVNEPKGIADEAEEADQI